MATFHLKKSLSRTLILGLLLIFFGGCASSKTAKEGYYRVQAGDTLTQIAKKNKQSVANLTRWNNISNPHNIKVGQLLKVSPNAGKTQTASKNNSSKNTSSSSYGSNSSASSAPTNANIYLLWPIKGQIISNFDGGLNKGISIAAEPGTPVQAAASGKVVYAGNGLRGYGNLVIITHSKENLTAYAHNDRLLVKEGDFVQAKQTIATVGSSESDRPKLHFELRYRGKAINPEPYLH